MPPKRKATPLPPMSPPRTSKRVRKTKANPIPIPIGSSDSGSEDDYLPTPDQSREEDDWEDLDDEVVEATPPAPSTSKGKGRAAPAKAPAPPKSKKGKSELAPAPPKSKKAKKPAGAYGTRKQIFHSLHYHLRSLIQSFGELEQTRVVRVQSERAKEHAHRKVLREEKEKIQCEMELERVKVERYKYLGPEELTAEYQLLVENKNLEVQRAQDATKELEVKLAELQLDLVKAKKEKEEALKDRLALEDQMLQKKLEARSTGRNYINVKLRELNLHSLSPLNFSTVLRAPISYLVAGMDAAAVYKQLQEAMLQAQSAMAVLNGVIDPNDKDDLPPPASNSLIATNPPVDPTGPSAGPSAGPVDRGNNTEDDNLDLIPRGAMAGLASKPPRLPPAHQGPLFPAPQPKRDPKVGAQIRQRTKRMFREEREVTMAEWEATKPILAELAFISNPYVARGRQEMLESYYSTMEEAEPHLTPEQLWHTETVLEFACITLHFRIKHSRGRDGGPVQARTAVAWCSYHIFNICAYTRDPETKELSGLTLLRRGLFVRLENLVKWCVIEFGLGRHMNHQHVLDRPAIQLIIERVLANSETHGRQVAFQTLTAMSFAMFGAFRAGTLQANCTEYRERKLYMQVGHLKLLVRGWCSYAVEVDVLNWKGYSGEIGHRKTLTFDPVTKAHNLIFEPGCHVALSFLARQLIQDVNTIDELIDYDKDELIIKDECREQPFLLKHSTRGLGLIEGVPCGPHKMSQVINHQAISVGLPGGGIHAIRRGSARHYASAMGQDRTLTLLNHNDRSGITMSTHYVPETHTPLVEIRLGELAGNVGPIEEAVMRNQAQGSPAIHALARRLQSTDARGSEIIRQGRCRITEKEEQAVQEDPKTAEIVAECKAAWKRFTELFPDANEPYSRHFVSTIDRVRSCPTKASSALVDVRVDELEKLGLKLRSARRQAFKRVRRADQKAATSTVISIEERKQAEQKMDEPSGVIAEAKDQMKAVISEYLRARRGEANEHNDESDEEEQGIETTKTSLPGRGLPPPAITISNKRPKISQLNISLQSAPEVDIPTHEDSDNDENFDDSSEPDVLQVPVAVMRAIYMRWIWKAYLEQTNRVEPNAKGELICAECPKFDSRRDNPDAFTFTKRDKFNRHMREQHDNYSNLELEMQTGDPTRFKCPGCEKSDFPSLKSCFEHCREDCTSSVDFKPLYDAHRAMRKTETSDDLARRDRDKERPFIGQEVEFPEDYSETLTDIQEDLRRPGFLQDWADDAGMTEDVARGHDLNDLQKLASQSVEIALGGAYRSGPDDKDLEDEAQDRERVHHAILQGVIVILGSEKQDLSGALKDINEAILTAERPNKRARTGD